jgi:Cu(I)/Ag(I) efflux system periplasmic protein CusF
MKTIRTLLVLAVSVLIPFAAIAQSTQSTDYAEAEVRRLDKAAGKITLKHGRIANLDMPPMTMVFQMKDKAQLDTLKNGDKILFKAEKEGREYVVTEIKSAP